MADTNVPGQMTGKPLIESDRVEGTTVYDSRGTNIGSIKRFMMQVAYAVLSFKTSTYGGFVGMGEEEHTIPWSTLTYDTNLDGYRIDVTHLDAAAAGLAVSLSSDVLIQDVAARVSRDREKPICQIVICVGLPAEYRQDDKAGEHPRHWPRSCPIPV